MRSSMKMILHGNRDVLFEFHLKFWNTASIGIPVRSLLVGRLLTAQQKGITARLIVFKQNISNTY